MGIDNNIKIALVHDWLSKDYKGGAEKVLKEIGELLSISHRTVEKHRANIISKLNLCLH